MSTRNSRRHASLLAVGLASLVTITAQPLAPAVAAPAPRDTASAQARRAVEEAARLGLPAVDLAARAAALNARLRLPQRRPLFDAPQCSTATSPLDGVVRAAAGRFTARDRLVASLTFADQLPTWEALMLPAGDARIASRTHGPELRRTLGQLQGFWDVDTHAVQLTEMSGSMLTDPARVQAVYQRQLGLSAPVAARYAQVVTTWARTSSAADKGDNPVFTFNAFAATLPDGGRRIVMGRGLMAAQDAVGQGVLGARAVLAHEYGHQVQFSLDWRPFVLDVKGGRAVELHADASAGYFAASRRGLALSGTDLDRLPGMFVQLGDCQTWLPGHHGTPAQRGAAAAWGVQQAATEPTAGIPAATFRSAFSTALPTRILPAPSAARLPRAA